ncbi:MAG: zf-HC2 domain-containing protein [Desulfobacterales bacterium]|nr:zf-HC2 domain-containing protein [Desulfobacterales bacterium]
MECAEIKQHLSGYLDGVLDAQTMDIINGHLSACKGCKQELESLQSLVKELRTLEPVKAPDDFLEKFHERLTPGFDFGGFIRKLFMPFRVKIPLQFATVAAMAVLIFFLVHTPEIKREVADIRSRDAMEKRAKKPAVMHTPGPTAEKGKSIIMPVLKERAPAGLRSERMAADVRQEKTPVMGAAMSEMDSAELKSYKTVSKQESRKRKAPHETLDQKIVRPIELAFVLKDGIIASDDIAQPAEKTKRSASLTKETIYKSRASEYTIATAARPDTKAKKDVLGEDKEMEAFGGQDLKLNDVPDTQAMPSDETLTPIKNLVNSVNGTVLAIVYVQDKDYPESISVEIPAGQYSSFCEKLQQLGAFQSPPPAIETEDPARINILIRFISL